MADLYQSEQEAIPCGSNLSSVPNVSRLSIAIRGTRNVFARQGVRRLKLDMKLEKAR